MKFVSKSLCVLMLCALPITAGCGDRRSDEQRYQDALASIEAGKYRAASVDLKNLLRADPQNGAARLALGRAMLEMGDFPAAEKELMRARELGVDANDYMLPWARTLLMRGAFVELISEIQPDMISDPGQRATVKAMRGNALFVLNPDDPDSVANVEAMFDEVLREKANPEAERVALVGKAEIARSKGDLQGAENFVRQSLDAVPDSVESTLSLGQVLMAAEKFAEAEQVFSFGREQLEPSAIEDFMLRVGFIEALLGQDSVEDARAAAEELAANGINHPLTGYLLGRAAFQGGDFPKAVEVLLDTNAKFPGSWQVEGMLGASSLNIGDLEQAEMFLSSALAKKPDNTIARSLLAETRMRMQRPDDAAATLRDGLRNDGGNAALLAMLGRTTVSQGDEAEGIRYLERSLESAPGNPQILLTLAAAYVSAGRYDDATRAINSLPDGAIDEQRREVLLLISGADRDNLRNSYDKVEALVEKWNDDPVILAIAGGFYQSAGDDERARASFERVLEIDPLNRNAIFSLGRMDEASGDYARTKPDLERYLAANPDDLLTLLALSRIAQRDGDVEKSMEYVRRASDAHPGALIPNLVLSGRALREGDLQGAEEYARLATSNHPESSQAHATLAMVLYRGNRFREALDSMTRASELRPDHAQLFHYRGQLEKRMALLAQARKSFVEALRLDGGDLRSAQELVLLEIRARNPDAAQAIVDKLKRELPGQPDPFELEGDAYAVQKRYTEALASYAKAKAIRPSSALALKTYRMRASNGSANAFSSLQEWLAANPDDAGTRLMLAQEYQVASRDAESIEQYEMIIKLAPDNAVAYNNLAWMYFEKGGPDDRLRALELGKRALEIAPQSAAIADTYGWILVRSGQSDRGTELLRQAMNGTSPKASPDIAYHLAAALQESGERGEAKRILAEALSSNAPFGDRDDAQMLYDSL